MGRERYQMVQIRRKVERYLGGTLPGKISKENFKSCVIGCGFRFHGCPP